MTSHVATEPSVSSRAKRLDSRPLTLDDGAIPSRRAAIDRRAAKAAPGRPEHEREQQPDAADDHQNHADGPDLQARNAGIHSECENRTDCQQDQTYSNTQQNLLGCAYRAVIPAAAQLETDGDTSRQEKPD